MTELNYVDDLPASTIQQLFVPACLPRTPNIRRGPDSSPDEIISLYTCDECSEKFVFQSSYKFHKDRCSIEITYNCRKCFRDLVFYNRCNFLAHLHQHNLEINEEELSSLEVTTRPVPVNMMPYFTLTECRQANEPKATHDSAAHNAKVCAACPECKVNLFCTLKEHFNNPKTYEKILHICTYCHLVLPTKCSLRAHMRIHTKMGTLICPECCISFPMWDSFFNHITNVCFHKYKTLRYKCLKCAILFLDLNELHKHFLSHHFRETPYITREYLNTSNVCELCCERVERGQFKVHLLHHLNDKSALLIVYHCPYSGCSVSCEEFLRFKKHISTCLHKRKAAPTSFSSLPNFQPRNEAEITNGSTKHALDILKSKGNIVVQKIESKAGYQTDQSSASTEGFRNVVRMPLTPSPEPLSEGSGQAHYGKSKHQTSSARLQQDCLPHANKTITSPGQSLLVPRLGKTSHELFCQKSVNEADVLVIKMHQCTICKELIVYDKKSEALKMHFKNKHNGRYKLGKIKPIEMVDSETSASISDLEDTPPLLKKQKPVIISPRRLKETAVRKETERKNEEKLSVVDSDEEYLSSVRNRVKQLQSISTVRTLIKDISPKRTPAKMSASSLNKKAGTVENNLKSDSSSDSEPTYKRKRKRDSSSDPDFECTQLLNIKPQTNGGHTLLRRRRTLDRKGSSAGNNNNGAELTTPTKKRNGSVKKKRSPQEAKQKSPHSNDLTAYYSNVVDEYKVMGSGIVVPNADFQSQNTFHCLNPGCVYASNDNDAFRDHIKTHRTDDNTFQCMECGVCFVVKPTFAKHLIVNHAIKDVDAYIKENDCCDKELIDLNIKQLEKRLEQQKMENVPMVLLENQCKICYQVCEDSLALKKHFRIHGMAFLRMNQNERNK